MENIFFVVLIALSHWPAMASPVVTEKLTVAEGDQWIEPSRPGPIWIEDGQTLQALQEAGHLRLKALKPGQSEIHIGNRHLWISVLSRRQNRTLQILREIVPKTIGLQVETHEGDIDIRGHLVRMEDWEVLAEGCAQRNCHYFMKAKVSKALQYEIQRIFEMKLQKISSYPYLIEFSENICLHLPHKFPQIEKVSDLLGRYGIEIVKDTSSLELQPLVKVQITVAEVKRSEALKYGLEWPESYKAQLIPFSSQALDPLFVSLQTMEKTGFGKVLASPNILCKSGKEAEFLAGGEFPIKIINFKMQDIVWKKYGILLRVKPQADFSGRMSISIETEVSSIDGDRTVDGIPGIYMNRLQSHFDLTGPQTIALSGLLKHETSEAQGGIPGLARIPILGSLFSSNDFRENKTELVIFVRPEIVGPQ